MQFPLGCAPSFTCECLVSSLPPTPHTPNQISMAHTHTQSMAVLSSPLQALCKLYMTQSNDF